MNRFATVVALLCTGFVAAPRAIALPMLQDPAPARPPARVVDARGLAMAGFDPVASFPAGGGAPVAGDARFEATIDRARYLFAKAEHRDWFLAETARYEPAFGGHDAAAMASGELRPADPRHVRRIGARLFLFADAAGANAWDSAAIARADEAWRAKTGELPRGRAADDARRDLPWNVDGKRLALEGYDPVAYFPEGGGSPRKGDAKLELDLEGVRYRFAREEHRAWFQAEPERYRPKYGGWCAYAMADGDRVEVDPKSFLIENGALLVFYDGLFADTRAKWRPRASELRPKADRNWTSAKAPAR